MSELPSLLEMEELVILLNT